MPEVRGRKQIQEESPVVWTNVHFRERKIAVQFKGTVCHFCRQGSRMKQIDVSVTLAGVVGFSVKQPPLLIKNLSI